MFLASVPLSTQPIAAGSTRRRFRPATDEDQEKEDERVFLRIPVAACNRSRPGSQPLRLRAQIREETEETDSGASNEHCDLGRRETSGSAGGLRQRGARYPRPCTANGGSVRARGFEAGLRHQGALGARLQEALVRLAFTPCLQYPYAASKNTSDIVLALDDVLGGRMWISLRNLAKSVAVE
jgi:hypothetical protein